MTSKRCHLCGAERLRQLLDFGPQALSNRYLTSAAQPEELFPFVLSQCEQCGLIQIADPLPASVLKASFDWIRYNEQEAHLDDVVAKIAVLPGITPHSTVGAISFKDDSTIGRFQKLGFSNTWRMDLQADLGVADPLAGLETIQAALTPGAAQEVVAKRGVSDLLIVRHILEHAHQPAQFAAALRRLVKPGGYLVFEVPDCEPALRRHDYTMFWEEHISYFTPEIFRESFRYWNLLSIQLEKYVYTNENSLVAFVKNAPAQTVERERSEKRLGALEPRISERNVPLSSSGGEGRGEEAVFSQPADLRKAQAAAEQLLALGRSYSDSFPEHRIKVIGALSEQRRKGKIAIFGAGHLSCAWVNFFGVGKEIEFVVDDHPRKKGLLMPGSHLPIRGSEALLAHDINLCLLTLSPESEAKVIQNNQTFIAKGGKFASIFPGKPNSFLDGVS